MNELLGGYLPRGLAHVFEGIHRLALGPEALPFLGRRDLVQWRIVVLVHLRAGRAPLGEDGGAWGVADIETAHEVPHVGFAPERGQFVIRGRGCVACVCVGAISSAGFALG